MNMLSSLLPRHPVIHAGNELAMSSRSINTEMQRNQTLADAAGKLTHYGVSV